MTSLNRIRLSHDVAHLISFFSDLKVFNNDDSEHRKMSPCPLFTIYLRKTEQGLGLGLIDGLVRILTYKFMKKCDNNAHVFAKQ